MPPKKETPKKEVQKKEVPDGFKALATSMALLAERFDTLEQEFRAIAAEHTALLGELQRRVEAYAEMTDLSDILARLTVIETIPAPEVKLVKSIHKTEDFNGDYPDPPREESNAKMNRQDKLFSMKNAAMILPPNHIINGRHSRENIQAICGFPVTEEMMDELYATFKHEC